jgi:phage terminase large subunit-like protein
VFLPAEGEWITPYVSEFCSFPKGANDDQVDSTTQALNYLYERPKSYAAAMAGLTRAGLNPIR